MSMGAPSTAILLVKPDLKPSLTGKTLVGLWFAKNVRKVLSEMFGGPIRFLGFPIILRVDPKSHGTRLARANLQSEAVTRRSKRRLSRIAKGLLNPLFKTSARADSQRWRSHRRRLQNSFGPRRSRLASQVNRVARAIISAIPATLTDACMAKLFEIRSRITNPTNDSNTLRQ
jgi:hypothetical protein